MTLKGIRSRLPVEVTWEGGKRYRGGFEGGPTLLVDGDGQEGPSPVAGLVVTIAACSAIDVVEILAKRRTPAESLSVRCDFARAETAPRRLTEVDLGFRVATASERHHVENAISLAIEKYCSVASSLAPDTTITWSLDLSAPKSEDAG